MKKRFNYYFLIILLSFIYTSNSVAKPRCEELHENIYNDVIVEKGILNFGNSIDADVIAMSTHGRQGLSHFFNGSISEDLVNHSKRPVVTFKI